MAALRDSAGTGSPIVLLHGLMGSADTWGDVAWLREFGRVSAYEAPGHGARARSGSVGTEAFVADLLEHLARLGEPVVLIGHSMGALHAVHAAALAPELVRALVIEDIGMDYRGRSAAGWAELIRQWPVPFADLRALLEYFGPVAGEYFARSLRRTDAGFVLPQPVEFFEAVAQEWGSGDSWVQWEAVRAPTLLLTAGAGVVPPGQAARMAQRPGVEWHEFPGVGHLIHDEVPERYRELVSKFLRRNGLP